MSGFAGLCFWRVSRYILRRLRFPVGFALRLLFVSLSSEPGLDSNWRGFILGWSVFAFSGRPVAVGGYLVFWQNRGV